MLKYASSINFCSSETKKEANTDNGTGPEANSGDKAATKENGTLNSTLDDETEGEGEGDDFINKELGDILREVDGETDIKYSDDEEDSNIGRYVAFSEMK